MSKVNVNEGSSLEALKQEAINESLRETDDQMDVETEEEIYVPKLAIRPKKKGENMRALGSRVPVWMIDELKLLADHHETNVEDMVSGILDSVLTDNMDAVYASIAATARKKRNSRR